jgi:leucyl aminopeptidase
MRRAWVLAAILGSAGPAIADEVYVTIGSDAVPTAQATLGNFMSIQGDNEDFAVLLVDERKLDELSQNMHDAHHRCGGFMVHETLGEAFALAEPERVMEYTLDRPDEVNAVLPELQAKRIETMIRELSSFKNRYYQSASGARASVWLQELWRGLTTRSDVTVELVDHGYEQKSVVMTIPGTTRPDEVIVIGGHLDSIAPGRMSATAPGADDDASGVSTLTEVARVLLAKDFRPERTIKFMAYAAEEVGLRGSLSIARDFKKNKVNVVGALQLDMTNYQGSNKDIWLISDYTSPTQNAFMISLIETYTKATWGWDKCGYACSDHASWHRNGVPASMPFEARFNEMNKSIHTNKDTIERSKENADHAVKFARLAAAYAIELGKGTLGPAVIEKPSCIVYETEPTSYEPPADDGCNLPWKVFAALASLGLAIMLWSRTSRIA